MCLFYLKRKFTQACIFTTDETTAKKQKALWPELRLTLRVGDGHVLGHDGLKKKAKRGKFDRPAVTYTTNVGRSATACRASNIGCVLAKRRVIILMLLRLHDEPLFQ